MSTIKVLIVEDEVMFRGCLKFFLEQDQDFEVVGCAGNGKEALELCGSYSPDVVLMDIGMPVCNGVEGTRLIKANYRQVKVIILTQFDDDPNIAKAIQNGADGYLLKSFEPVDLIAAIKNTVKGLTVFPQKVLKTVVDQFKTVTDANAKLIQGLTEKEICIIKLVAQGKSNREIAEELHFAESYIKKINGVILAKLGLESGKEIVKFAFENNLIDRDTESRKSRDKENEAL
ncbi:MAG TPA: response regulator transcription factor [Bacillota bacterium]|nr:response regulator transcription factor [Bacillota bacterium]